MNRPSQCPECGAALPEVDAPCSKCMLATGLEFGDQPRLGPGFLDDLPFGGDNGRHIGGYELLETIATGGMGVVYKARQRRLSRTVALKLIRGRADANEAARKRFRQEAELAAKLQHPNIVPIYEVGEEEGLSFFSMEYVEGRDLGNLTGGRPLPPRTAAEYLKIVTEAIHYAHQQGVLHRDLKPSNILLGKDGRLRITDFGLARQLETESSMTATGETLGTPGYLPPEQISFKKTTVSPASDVYSLGAVLYHFLTGVPPFDADTVPRVLRMVEELPAPAPRRHDPAIPADLETICLKCLEKEPSRRYASAQLLAEDLGRFLRDEPILARPISSAGRLWRWSRRKPVVAGLLCALVIVATAGGLLIRSQSRDKQREAVLRNRTEAQQLFQEVQTGFEQREVSKPLGLLARELRLRPENRVAAERLLNALASRSLLVAARSGLAPLAQSGMWSEDGRAVLIRGAGKTNAPGTSTGQNSPGDERHGSLTLLPVQSGTCRQLEIAGRVEAIAIKTELQMAAAEPGGAVRVWLNADSRATLVLSNGTATARQLIFPTESKLLGVFENQVGVWSLPEGNFSPWPVSTEQEFVKCAWHPSTRRVAIADLAGHIYLLDANSGQPLRTITNAHEKVIRALAFNPEGTRLVSAGADGRAWLWDPTSGSRVAPLVTHPEGLTDARFSPEGRWLAVAGSEQVWLWDSSDLKSPRLELPAPSVNGLAFNPDGTELATSGHDKTVRVWKTDDGELAAEPAAFAHSVLQVAFSPDGDQILAIVDDEGAVLLRQTRPRSPVSTTATPLAAEPKLPESERANYAKAHQPGGMLAAASPNGTLAATTVLDDTVIIWERRNQRLLVTLKHPDQARVNCIRFSPDGRRLVASTSRQEFRVWDTQTGLPLTDPISPGSPVMEVRFSSDGGLVHFAEDQAWPILQVGQPVPDWLPQLAEAIGGRRYIKADKTEYLPLDKFAEVVAKLKSAKPSELWIPWLQAYLP